MPRSISRAAAASPTGPPPMTATGSAFGALFPCVPRGASFWMIVDMLVLSVQPRSPAGASVPIADRFDLEDEFGTSLVAPLLDQPLGLVGTGRFDHVGLARRVHFALEEI